MIGSDDILHMGHTREYLSSKIHGAIVTDIDLNYEGSISIDEELLKKSDMHEYQKVLVASLDSGERFETYITKTTGFSGKIKINGVDAHKIKKGERIVIASFEFASNDKHLSELECPFIVPTIIYVNEKNQPIGLKI